ncbi:MAG TPA: hypothetical protein EYQ54_07190 [Myxococcales bacterium]|nr:hypothetical protein [Myxococcales bacterium]
MEAVRQHLHLDRTAYGPACDLVGQFLLFTLELGNFEIAEHELGTQFDGVALKRGILSKKLVALLCDFFVGTASDAAREHEERRGRSEEQKGRTRSDECVHDEPPIGASTIPNPATMRRTKKKMTTD